MVDTHCHLNFKVFKNDYREVISRSFKNGIKELIIVGSNYETSKRAIEIAKKFKNCYVSPGLHPIHVYPVKSPKGRGISPKAKLFNRVEEEEFDKQEYIPLIRANSRMVKAIGETGFDYTVFVPAKAGLQKRVSAEVGDEGGQKGKIIELQKQIFLKHLELAKEFNLPVILHCRGEASNPFRAYQDLLREIKRFASGPPSSVNRRTSADTQFSNFAYAQRKLAGVLHCFSGNWQIAQKFLDLGFYIGFTGIVTYKNCGQDLLEVIEKTPLEKVLIDLTPISSKSLRFTPYLLT